MRCAASDEDLARDPIGAYRAGPGFVWFCPRAELCGFAVWGRLDADQVRRLCRLLEVELEAPIPPHASLVDASRLAGVDPRGFETLAAYVRTHFDDLTRQVKRLALVRPAGVVGAIVAGFYHVLERPYPVEVRSDGAAALSSLGVDDIGFLSELEALVADISGVPPFLLELRGHLDARPGELRPPAAARTLGMSLRSLQRRLAAVGTTFHNERRQSQVRVAQWLLLESDAPVTQVALEVGSTSQQLSGLFRQLVGEPPSEWRRRHQSARSSGGQSGQP